MDTVPMFQCLRFGEALVVVVLSNTPQTISDFSFEHCRYGQDMASASASMLPSPV